MARPSSSWVRIAPLRRARWRCRGSPAARGRRGSPRSGWCRAAARCLPRAPCGARSRPRRRCRPCRARPGWRRRWRPPRRDWSRAHPADAAGTRQLDRERAAACLTASATDLLVAVDERDRRTALHHRDARTRIEHAAPELSHVSGQTEHAVRIRAGEVGFQHGVGSCGGIGLGETAGAQRVEQECPQRGGDTCVPRLRLGRRKGLSITCHGYRQA